MPMYQRMYLWWSLCTYVVFTRMPGESYLRRLSSLLLCLGCVFRALIDSLVCWLILLKSFVALTHCKVLQGKQNGHLHFASDNTPPPPTPAPPPPPPPQLRPPPSPSFFVDSSCCAQDRCQVFNLYCRQFLAEILFLYRAVSRMI